MLKGRNIGSLDILLTIEQPVLTRNSINEDVISWSTFTQVYAERIWQQSKEKFEGSQQVGSDNVQFKARYIDGVDTTMRLKEGIETTYFYITNIFSTIEEGITTIYALRRDNA